MVTIWSAANVISKNVSVAVLQATILVKIHVAEGLKEEFRLNFG